MPTTVRGLLRSRQAMIVLRTGRHFPRVFTPIEDAPPELCTQIATPQGFS
jgi:hypothetical protein